MTVKSLYVRDETVWSEASSICERRGKSMSALVNELLRDWVMSAQSPKAKEMGLRPGMKVPASQMSPEEVRLEETITDLTDIMRSKLTELYREQVS